MNENGQLTMYADDTSISYPYKDIKELDVTLNCESDSLKHWLLGNKLSLNVIKAQAMVIGSRPNIRKVPLKSVPAPSFTIGGSSIDVVENTKYLGVQLDKHLVWDNQIEAVRSRVSRSLGFLKCAKKLLPKRRKLCFTFCTAP